MVVETLAKWMRQYMQSHVLNCHWLGIRNLLELPEDEAPDLEDLRKTVCEAVRESATLEHCLQRVLWPSRRSSLSVTRDLLKMPDQEILPLMKHLGCRNLSCDSKYLTSPQMEEYLEALQWSSKLGGLSRLQWLMREEMIDLIEILKEMQDSEGVKKLLEYEFLPVAASIADGLRTLVGMILTDPPAEVHEAICAKLEALGLWERPEP